MARTTLGPSTILLIVAVILFILGAFVALGGVSLTALGLAAFAGAFLVRDLT